MSVDVIIPLGTGSKSNNDELRLLLRSIDKNCLNLGRIIIVTDKIPTWLKNVTVIKFKSQYKNNTDAVIIDKISAALALDDITEQFVWTADDFIFLQTIDLNHLPVIENLRGYEFFKEAKDKWCKRVAHTFEYFKSKGIDLEVNFDSHTPQLCDTKRLTEALKGVDYSSDPGYSVGTLFMGLLGITRGIDQSLLKDTNEDEGSAELGKLFCGYNDKAFLSGLREKLFDRFHEKSKYEAF